MTLPTIPDAFEWTQEPWGLALRCRPLAAIAPHLFTTRELPLSSDHDWGLAATAVGAGRGIVTLTQVHGRGVVVVRSPEGPRHHHRKVPDRDRPVVQPLQVAQRFSAASDRPEGDVLVSNDPDVAIAVRAADCVPLLLADPRTGAVAAVHAGWRGTAAGAAVAAVEAMAREFGAKAADLIAAIGPSIGDCCYEVGGELIDAFTAAGHARPLVDAWFTPAPTPGRLRLDMWAAHRDQLRLAGVRNEHIHTSALCTATHVRLFASYRVEKDRAGRIAGVIRSPLTFDV